MKILKQFLDSEEACSKRILSWLHWLKGNCDSCDYCCYKLGNYCEVMRTLACKTRLDIAIIYPERWELRSSTIPSAKPPDLDFLCKIEWSKDGNPIPKLKKEYVFLG